MKINLLLKLVPVVLFALGLFVGCGGGGEDGHEGHDHNGDGNASDHDH